MNFKKIDFDSLRRNVKFVTTKFCHRNGLSLLRAGRPYHRPGRLYILERITTLVREWLGVIKKIMSRDCLGFTPIA